MRPGPFRFEALLDVYQTQEDSLVGEIASLEGERKGVQRQIEGLWRECDKAQNALCRGGRASEVESFVRYVEGLRHWIRQSRLREEQLLKRIGERTAVLRTIRTERLRFGKLKEHHRKQIHQHTKRLEQKVTDEFSQRKRNP